MDDHFDRGHLANMRLYQHEAEHGIATIPSGGILEILSIPSMPDGVRGFHILLSSRPETSRRFVPGPPDPSPTCQPEDPAQVTARQPISILDLAGRATLASPNKYYPNYGTTTTSIDTNIWRSSRRPHKRNFIAVITPICPAYRAIERPVHGLLRKSGGCGGHCRDP